MDNKEKFECFLEKRNDELDNATMDLIRLFTKNPNLEHNMELIGAVEEAVEAALYNQGIGYCHPFFVDALCGGNCDTCDDIDCQNNPDYCRCITKPSSEDDTEWVPCFTIYEEEEDDSNELSRTNSNGCNKAHCQYLSMEAKEIKETEE